jgi:NAD+ kinase
MKVMIVDGEYRHKLDQLLQEVGIDLVKDNPEFIITYGGDGTLLGAERSYPGVPKLPIRDGDINDEETRKRFLKQLQKLKNGEYAQRSYYKLDLTVKGKNLTALNDVTITQKLQPSSLRYRIWVNKRPYPREIVGDGIVAATTFGSTAYYRSITDSAFQVGMGLAFNNSTEQIDHQVLREDSVIRMQITRGPAIAFADNNPECLVLNVNDEAIIQKSKDTAFILGIENLRRRSQHSYPYSVFE